MQVFPAAETVDLPPLNGLRAFEAAGRHKNFRRAADELGVTQGAVAQHVRKLEERLGVKLFERRPRGVRFTEAGKRYHAQVEAAFRLIGDATAQVLPRISRVTMMAPQDLASRWLLPAMSDFDAAHPDIDLRLLASNVDPETHRGAVDLYVGQRVDTQGGDLVEYPLLEDESIAVCAPALTEGGGAALLGRPLLHDPQDLWPSFIETVLGLPRPTRLPGPRFETCGSAIDAALEGQGVALVSRILVQEHLAQGRLTRAHSAVLLSNRPYMAILAPETANQPVILAVLKWLETRVALGFGNRTAHFATADMA